MRRTKLPIAELSGIVKAGGTRGGGCGCGGVIKPCFYVNEIGQALKDGSDEEIIEAKEALVDLLSDRDEDVSCTAYFYLYVRLSRDTEDMNLVSVMASFENDPKNKKIVDLVKKEAKNP